VADKCAAQGEHALLPTRQGSRRLPPPLAKDGKGVERRRQGPSRSKNGKIVVDRQMCEDTMRLRHRQQPALGALLRVQVAERHAFPEQGAGAQLDRAGED
jgi:hypothetical protein